MVITLQWLKRTDLLVQDILVEKTGPLVALTRGLWKQFIHYFIYCLAHIMSLWTPIFHAGRKVQSEFAILSRGYFRIGAPAAIVIGSANCFALTIGFQRKVCLIASKITLPKRRSIESKRFQSSQSSICR